jgi:spermidine/putrescine transport system permease protein
MKAKKTLMPELRNTRGMKMKTRKALFLIPYLMWIILFVILPILLILWYSFTDSNRSFTLNNYATFFRNGTFLRMMFNSFWYALLITLITLLISYPAAYFLTKMKNQQLWLLLIILPTWINLLLKAYAFIGILGNNGLVNKFLQLFGIGPVNILFTDFAFIFVATYIEIPFMILPIFNAIKEINPAVIQASEDLGASRWQTFKYVLWPLSRPGVESGVQAIFIPSLSLFMLTRLIGGNRVITLGTAIEEYFMTTMNWNMGATIGVILIVLMVIAMLITSRKARRKKVDL